MKLQFVSYDNIDIIKSNLKSWVDNFKQDSSEWLQEELGNALFSDTKFAEIPDFSLDKAFLVRERLAPNPKKKCCCTLPTVHFLLMSHLYFT